MPWQPFCKCDLLGVGNLSEGLDNQALAGTLDDLIVAELANNVILLLGCKPTLPSPGATTDWTKPNGLMLITAVTC